MPALYAHYRFGEEVLKTLPACFSDHAEKYPESFALGTQGPDILFYHHPMKKNEIRSYGTHLHALAAEDFYLDTAALLLENAKGESAEEVLRQNGAFAAYICGFLCHFTLDVSCHKYIDDNSTDKLSHGKIESEFDKFLLKKDGKPIRGYNTATPIKDENGTSEACSKALNIPQENISLAINTMRKINGWFSKKCEAFHSFAHFFLKIAGMERKFGDMFIHKKDDPLCEEINRVLYGKFEAAVPMGATLIEEYFSNLPKLLKKRQLAEIFRYNYSGIKIKEN
ncbi:MAG: zinc dependent phospholipase C family protein [Clostridia bacterium]|nr:zinc dependent phospholipase C family protein [Clostridia bacterium]